MQNAIGASSMVRTVKQPTQHVIRGRRLLVGEQPLTVSSVGVTATSLYTLVTGSKRLLVFYNPTSMFD